MSLTALLGRVAKRMQFEIEDVRDAFTHGGIKGAALEISVVETFLRPYLPEKIGICTGQIIDATGARSKQLDVVLYDRSNTPILKRSAEIRLVPAKCVFGVIEVKANIRSKKDVKAIFDNMKSVRSLSRDAITPDPRLARLIVGSHGVPVGSFPVQYSCFAFECGLAPETAKKYLDAECRGLSANDCVDMVLAIGKVGSADTPGALWVLEDGCPAVYKRGQSGQEMVEFYLRLHQHFSMAMMAGFLDLNKYLSARTGRRASVAPKKDRS